MRHASLLSVVVLSLSLAACGTPRQRTEKAAAPTPGAPWGGGAIAWVDAAAGLARARAEGKKALVVVTAEWCSHCRNYAKVFSDPRVVEESQKFVMIKLDADRDAAARQFAVDGTYIPRTVFVRSDGSIDTDVHADRQSERYFYDEYNAGPLLAAMTRALR